MGNFSHVYNSSNSKLRINIFKRTDLQLEDLITYTNTGAYLAQKDIPLECVSI